MMNRFIADDNGHSAVEYALTLLIMLSIVTLSISMIDAKVSALLSNIGQLLNSNINSIS